MFRRGNLELGKENGKSPFFNELFYKYCKDFTNDEACFNKSTLNDTSVE